MIYFFIKWRSLSSSLQGTGTVVSALKTCWPLPPWLISPCCHLPTPCAEDLGWGATWNEREVTCPISCRCFENETSGQHCLDPLKVPFTTTLCVITKYQENGFAGQKQTVLRWNVCHFLQNTVNCSFLLVSVAVVTVKVFGSDAHSGHPSLSDLLYSRPRWLLCPQVFI